MQNLINDETDQFHGDVINLEAKGDKYLGFQQISCKGAHLIMRFFVQLLRHRKIS